MAEYRNPKTGVVVSVPESVGASLRSYERVGVPTGDGAAAEKPTTRRKRKSEDEDD